MAHLVITDPVLQAIEMFKLEKPSIYASEIQSKLLALGICNVIDVPAVETINAALRNKLKMTWKKLTPIPKERNDELVDDFLEEISQEDPQTLHFFDQSSVC